MTDRKKMAVLGAGAIGCTIGGYISKAGEDIVLIDSWQEHVDAMRTRGLKITGAKDEQLIKVKALSMSELGLLDHDIDTLFVAVKSQDTEQAILSIKPHLTQDACVISCQNGINEDIIIPILGSANILGCAVNLSCALWEPGHVNEVDVKLGFTLGELDGSITSRTKEIARILSLCNKTDISSNIWGELWAKLALNCMGNAFSSIAGTKLRDLLKNGIARRIVVQIASEVIQVAEALGHKIEKKIFGVNSDEYKTLSQTWLPEIDDIFINQSNNFPDTYASTAQDLMKHRPMEVDWLNGYVARRGRETGIPTPVNEIIVSLAKDIENGAIHPDPENINTLHNRIIDKLGKRI